MKLAEFNRIVNPNDEACYIIETPQGNINKARFADIKSILLTRNDVALKMIVPSGLLILETKCELLVDAIKERNEPVLVAQKEDRFYIYAFSKFDKSTSNNILACGANANTIVHTKKGTEILLPFHSKKNVLAKYSTTDIIYSNGIGKLPFWLEPTKKASLVNDESINLPITENKTKMLMNHIMDQASFSREQQKELLRIMNKHFVVPPLDDKTIEELCDSIADNLLAEFMNKNEFYHDKFGDYVIKALHIHKDITTKILYYYDERKQIYVGDENYLRGYITKLCPRLKQYQKDEAIKYINDILENDAVTFNEDPFNIVFRNGILNLLSMEFEPMSPDHLETIQIHANYDPNAHSDTADEFFNNVTCGNEEEKQLLFESIGYAMLKTVDLAKQFMVTGQGRNGKSTYFDLINAILGEENCTTMSPNDLTNTFRASTLVNKLASLAADISAKPLTETSTLKNISAGDRIMIEKKFKDAYEGRVFATLFFAMNKLQRTPDTSFGFYRRQIIIPFNADLTKVRNVEGAMFKRKLLSQESIDYVAYKAVQAIYRVYTTTQEFTEPASVIAMKNAYRINNSSILSWFKEEYVDNKINPTPEEKEAGKQRIRKMQLGIAYTKYADWCKITNKQALARPNFEEEMKIELGIAWGEEEN